jgi:hypothetical protein
LPALVVNRKVYLELHFNMSAPLTTNILFDALPDDYKTETQPDRIQAAISQILNENLTRQRIMQAASDLTAHLSDPNRKKAIEDIVVPMLTTESKRRATQVTPTTSATTTTTTTVTVTLPIAPGNQIRETIPKLIERSKTSEDMTDEDLNGECFIVHGEGENYIGEASTRVIFAHNTPRAATQGEIRKVPFSAPAIREFLLVNAAAVKEAVPELSTKDAATIAYLRYLAVSNGLISPNFDVAAYHVIYNDAIELDDRIIQAYRSQNADLTFLSSFNRNVIREQFTDLVCCVAYMFRVRGHHYLPDMEGRYLSLWERCLRTAGNMPCTWLAVSRYAFHAIMPVILDKFWKFCVDGSYIAGTLCKRYDSAPAGSSGVLALAKGVRDIQLILPQALEIAHEEVADLSKIADIVTAERWSTSVNARYYGATRVRVDEGKIGVLASVVLGIYERLAPTSQLRNAPSVKRLATLAPATGGAIGRIAANTVADERMTLRHSAATRTIAEG